jgi:acyl-coenzyme A synthetase/AMP-(fatty) acid ligase
MNTPEKNYAYLVSTLNAQRTPDRVALTCGGREYTFEALNRRVNRTANALLALDVQAGSKMAALIHDPLAITECYLALAKMGVTLVALNPYWEDSVTTEVLRHCSVQGVLFQQQSAKEMATLRDQLDPTVKWIQLENGGQADDVFCLERAQQEASEQEPEIRGGGEDTLAFYFTSGTTGLPKAAVHTHDSCRAMAGLWDDLPHDDNSVWGTGPIIWGIGFPCTIGAALLGGMRVALEDDFGPAGLLQAIQGQPISHCCVIPSFWSDLLSNHDHQQVDLSALKVVLLVGEPLGANLLERIKSRIPDANIYACYGQTEAPYTCIGRLDDGSQAANVAGKARRGCVAQVLAPDGHPVIGEPGDLAVSGPHCTQGYFDQPEKTAEALRDGWFFSGDLAQQDKERRITVLGRREDAIVRSGQYVQPLDVEDAAMGIAGVTEAGAVGVGGVEGEQKILLAVALSETMSEDDILARLQQHLPAHAVPDRVVICDELPHGNDASGGKGKLLRRTIRDDYAHLVAGSQ